MLKNFPSLIIVFVFISLAQGLQLTFCLAESSPQHPNVLWITSEDNAAHWLSCYGNAEGYTPRLDALAAEGILFTHAYSNAPVCAVARSTILRGAYATTTGTQHMRSRYAVPDRFTPYVTYLREQGYYCTNRSKTDYNSLGEDRALWDECSRKAHYKNRPDDQPFFAVINVTVTHESTLFPEKVAKHREQGIIPKTTRLKPTSIAVPPHLPDLPEVRSDLAVYYDNLTAMDFRIGQILDELESRGFADDTIVFYYSDHGGPTPRGKRYLTDTGVRVPLLIRMPPKWQHLSPFKPGQKVSELAAFVDFAPTLLSLCGIKPPKQMQGRTLLGNHRMAPPQNQLVYLFADRFDGFNGMRRGVSDGRYKYIRRFTPHLPAAPYSDYQLSMPSWTAWQRAWQEGRLTERHRRLWEFPQEVEELYDTETDPWEVENLAGDIDHAERLELMRSQLREKMYEVRDTSLVPEALFLTAAAESALYDYVQAEEFDYLRILDLAFLASKGDIQNTTALLKACRDSNPIVRYWGVLGCAVLGEAAADECVLTVRELLEDPQPAVRMTASEAMFAMGYLDEARQATIEELDNEHDSPESIMLLNTLARVDAIEAIPQDWLNRMASDSARNEYVRRFVERVQKSRASQ